MTVQHLLPFLHSIFNRVKKENRVEAKRKFIQESLLFYWIESKGAELGLFFVLI